MQSRSNLRVLQGSATIPKGRIDKHFKAGVLFVTYSLLVTNAKAMAQDVTNGETGGVDAQIPSGSRLAQIVEWLKGETAPLIVLDECHKAKNLVASGGDLLIRVGVSRSALLFLHALQGFLGLSHTGAGGGGFHIDFCTSH